MGAGKGHGDFPQPTLWRGESAGMDMGGSSGRIPARGGMAEGAELATRFARGDSVHQPRVVDPGGSGGLDVGPRLGPGISFAVAAFDPAESGAQRGARLLYRGG